MMINVTYKKGMAHFQKYTVAFRDSVVAKLFAKVHTQKRHSVYITPGLNCITSHGTCVETT